MAFFRVGTSTILSGPLVARHLEELWGRRDSGIIDSNFSKALWNQASGGFGPLDVRARFRLTNEIKMVAEWEAESGKLQSWWSFLFKVWRRIYVWGLMFKSASSGISLFLLSLLLKMMNYSQILFHLVSSCLQSDVSCLMWTYGCLYKSVLEG